MPQIHIKLDKATHERLSKKAREFNFSIQEFAERALSLAVDNPLETIFSSKNNEDSNSETLFTFIDLFAGIGGIRLALEQNKGKCIFSSEWDRWSQKTYFDNFGEMPAGDINEVRLKEIPDHDILSAGFPCQPFSIAGVSKKKSLGKEHGFKDKTQGTLFFKVAEIIEAKRPKAFLLENVKHLRNHDRGQTFAIIEGTLRELGYTIVHDIVNAAHYVPQHRERLFIVGFNRDIYGEKVDFNFPEIPNANPHLGSILEKRVDAKYTLSDKLWKYLQDYAEKHRRKGNGFGYGLFGSKDVARTLSARYHKDGSEILIKNGNLNPRRLTPHECARLMGFPHNFKIMVSDTQAYRQFGNSVVVPVVAAVASELVKAAGLGAASTRQSVRNG